MLQIKSYKMQRKIKKQNKFFIEGSDVDIKDAIQKITNSEHCCQALSICRLEISNFLFGCLSSVAWSELLILKFQDCTFENAQKMTQINCSKLENLSIKNCKFQQQNKLAAAKIFNYFVQFVQFLEIIKCQLSGVQLKVINEASGTKIKKLILKQNSIGSIGLKYLSKANLPALYLLHFGWCDIGNTGIRHLSKSLFPSLKWINLWNNWLTYQAYNHMRLFHFKLMKILYLSYEDYNDSCYCEPISALNLVNVSSQQVMANISNEYFWENINEVLERVFSGSENLGMGNDF